MLKSAKGRILHHSNGNYMLFFESCDGFHRLRNYNLSNIQAYLVFRYLVTIPPLIMSGQMLRDNMVPALFRSAKRRCSTTSSKCSCSSVSATPPCVASSCSRRPSCDGSSPCGSWRGSRWTFGWCWYLLYSVDLFYVLCMWVLVRKLLASRRLTQFKVYMWLIVDVAGRFGYDMTS